MNNTQHYLIRLSEDDLGQLILGVEVRYKTWENTATFEETGRVKYLDYDMEQCRDAEEAWNMANHYKRILDTLVEQWKEQQGDQEG